MLKFKYISRETGRETEDKKDYDKECEENESKEVRWKVGIDWDKNVE